MQAATISRRSNGAPRPCAMIGPPRTSTNSSSGTRGPVSGNMGSRVLALARAASSRLSGLAGAYTRA